MTLNRKILISFFAALLAVGAGLAIWFILKSNAYDAPVREISLKIDALAEAELAPGTTIEELERRSSLLEQELLSDASKIPAGQDEMIVKAYFDAALNYVTMLNRWLNALKRQSFASEQIKNPQKFTDSCTSYGTAISMGLCLTNASSEMEDAFKNFKILTAEYENSLKEKQSAMLALATARHEANTVVTQKSIADTPNFDRLLSKFN